MTVVALKNGVPIIKDGKLATNCACCDPVCKPLPALPDSIEVVITRGQTGYATAVIGEFPSGGPESPKFAFGAAWAFPEGTFVLTQNSPGSYLYVFSNAVFGDLFASFVPGENRFFTLIFRLPVVRLATFFDTDTPPTQEYLLDDEFRLNTECSGGNVLYYPKGDVTPPFSVSRCTFLPNAELRVQEGCNSGVPYDRFFSGLNPIDAPSVNVTSATGCAFPVEVSVPLLVHIPNVSGVFSTTTDLSRHRNPLVRNYMYTFSTNGVDGIRESDGSPFATKTATCTIESVRMVYGEESVDMFPPVGDSVCEYLLP